MKVGTGPDSYGASNVDGPPLRSPGSMTISSVMNDLKEKFKNDEDDTSSPFQNLDKATVLQETKIFSDSTQVTKHPKKCCQLITKLLHILTQGEPFTSTETTEVFFGVTKLFQSKDANLRRMMYLFIKEVAEATAADEVIIVTQSLTKDMSSDIDLYRANAIRVLCRIIDGSMLNAIERFMKQAIVDRNALVASSALVSGIHLIQNNPEIVRRWVNEVQEAVSSSHDMVQYHGVALMYAIRRHDKLAVSKFLTQLQKTNLRSPLATCLLIRYTTMLLKEDITLNGGSRHSDGQIDALQPLYAFLQKMLKSKNEMVIYEAARSLCSLPVESRDLTQAIVVLQLFLSSSKPTLRFAAVRTLNAVAMTQPLLVTRCNEDMESLISDANRSIATLAITTLLKTGAESSVDRLMKQISTFMSEIADEFKIVVVEAIKNLCQKYPSKYRVLLNFLANILREEGGFEFKRTITDAFLFLLERLPECKEAALLHLCEFIEDCEFTALSTKILRVLGEKGPTTSAPARYIRFIRNRVILENAAVRASAVSALAQFAIRVPGLRTSISSLLQSCKLDDDDEVRDRATMYLSILDSSTPVDPAAEEKEIDNVSHRLLVEEFPMSILALQQSLVQYKLRPSEGALTFSVLPHVEVVETMSSTQTNPLSATGGHDVAAAPEPVTAQDIAKELYKIPEFAQLGPIFRSSKALFLTESESEYVVSCVKHVFVNHVVLQYSVLNTVNDQLLKNVEIGLTCDIEDEWEVESVITLPEAAYGNTGYTYVCLKHISEEYPIVQITNELKFKVYEVNPNTGEVEDEDGFDEEYPLEDFEIAAGDFMAKVPVNDFRSAWEHMGDGGEAKGSYALKYKTLVEGVAAVIENVGMQPCDNTAVPQANTNAHILLLSGMFVGSVKVLVKSRISLDEKSGGMILQMAVRSESEDVSQTILDCIR